MYACRYMYILYCVEMQLTAICFLYLQRILISLSCLRIEHDMLFYYRGPV